jgi:hypothetical protein
MREKRTSAVAEIRPLIDATTASQKKIAGLPRKTAMKSLRLIVEWFIQGWSIHPDVGQGFGGTERFEKSLFYSNMTSLFVWFVKFLKIQDSVVNRGATILQEILSNLIG